jgi:hypothetical protein
VEEHQISALNLSLDPMTLLDDLEKVYPNQYHRFKAIQEMQKYLKEEPSESFDLEKWKGELDSWIDTSQNSKTTTEKSDQYMNNYCPTFQVVIQ